MLTAQIGAGPTAVAIVLGLLDATVIRLLGATFAVLLAVSILWLQFYVGDPTSVRATADSSTDELASRPGADWVAAMLVTIATAGVGFVGVQFLLDTYPLAVTGDLAFPVGLTSATATGTSVFAAMALNAIRYLVFAGGVLVVLGANEQQRTPWQLAVVAFVAAALLPTGLLLAVGVEFDLGRSVSIGRDAVFPTVAVVGFQRAYELVDVDGPADAAGSDGRSPLVRRVAGVFLDCQRIYGRLTGASIAVSDTALCHTIAARTLATTGAGATLAGVVWFVETLSRGWWEYVPTPGGVVAVLVGDLLRVGVGVVVTTLALTALVLATLWLVVPPLAASRIVFAVGTFSVSCGALNVLTTFVLPTPVHVMVGHVVNWRLVASQPGSSLIWLADLFNAPAAIVLVGFACGAITLRRTAVGRA
ncbi:hypothetical protein SAMN04487948_10762 [Halogranum amylolyticum]|uniref:Uncharacterized protein n=1 Tax=Halogranum amylolyticum TaxID=660520 RepID=A0A1H8TIY1_9EURY|nr:hypothetical protein [Halogranum amylolyticum]SEO90468.1 hypothetical protein SAMN04487948_10762 [Halogranum amylolyticum]